jgi:hypothetical protein
LDIQGNFLQKKEMLLTLKPIESLIGGDRHRIPFDLCFILRSIFCDGRFSSTTVREQAPIDGLEWARLGLASSHKKKFERKIVAALLRQIDSLPLGYRSSLGF